MMKIACEVVLNQCEAFDDVAHSNLKGYVIKFVKRTPPVSEVNVDGKSLSLLTNMPTVDAIVVVNIDGSDSTLVQLPLEAIFITDKAYV